MTSVLDIVFTTKNDFTHDSAGGGPMTTKSSFQTGMIFAIASAVTFATTGPFAKALMETGWSPIAAVTARMAGGALVMALFATVVRRGWWREAVAHYRTIVVYGLIPVAGAQLCYYCAVAHLSVGVALLLEYLAPVLVVGWIWATTQRRPAALTLAGAALALTGTLVVLDVFSGAHIDGVGVAWALGAMVCAACYFVMSGRVAADEDGLHPVTLATGGLIVGAATVATLGVTRVLPMTFTTHDTVVAGHTTSFLMPIVVLGVVSTAMAYLLGIFAISRLRPSYASLVGLGEVLSAVVWAWLLLGEAISPTQAIGGAVVLVGLALAGRSSDHRTVESAWLETASTEGLLDADGCATGPGLPAKRPN
jgi:drug/metabolite transporter (DMT)-like permease